MLTQQFATSGSTEGLIDSPPQIQSNLRQASFAGIVSECSPMQRVFGLVSKVSRTNSTVLILGESGTGKELIARAIHKLSGRTGKLVPVNCGAIPEDILESELFGHERGSFTGAVAAKIGRFQMADGGTIFLDEIGEMSPRLQVKLLRVLQERKVEPVGATRFVDVDVRVIAATNKDLREEVKAGRFREDLYYRLQVVPVELPSLRDRGDDVSLLARYFMERACRSIGRPQIEFSTECMARLVEYRWPGNVRELENLIERLAILAESNSIGSGDLPGYIAFDRDSADSTGTMPALADLPSDGVDFNACIDELETTLITRALERTNWNKKAAAKLLKLNRTTLVEKIKKKGLEQRIEVLRISSQGSPDGLRPEGLLE
jgi:two-component system response regulator PilR (NtrC family)